MTSALVRDPLGRPSPHATWPSALDALREGYEVYPVVDAIGGTSAEAHRLAWTASSKPADTRSAGSLSWSSCSATGRARTKSPRSSTSSSPTAC